jgi:adenylate cyclase
VEFELLGGPARYTRSEVAELAGVHLDRLRRLWVALGFPEVKEHEVAFTEGDLEVLRNWNSLVTTGAIASDDEVAIARALGQSMSRLAEWQIRELNVITKRVGLAEGTDLGLQLLHLMESTQNLIWRRHLAAVAGRGLLSPTEEVTTANLIVGFVDIVGYTSVTRRSDYDSLVGLIEEFELRSTSIIIRNHGRVIKTVGDEILFVADTAVDAAAIALDLIAFATSTAKFPELRVGLAQGEVIARYGDIFGGVVNMAARLRALAEPNSIRVDRELAAQLAKIGEYDLTQLPQVAVRGYDHLEPWHLIGKISGPPADSTPVTQ